MLWWSVDSANSCCFYAQLYSNVIINRDDSEWKLFEAASSTFMMIRSMCHMTKRILSDIPREHHNWQRCECGWKCFNLCTNNTSITSCWSACSAWSDDACLGLNACKRVVERTGMYLFLWCGLVLFRLDETTHISFHMHILHLYVCKRSSTLVIMKWFHLTCC